MRYWVTTHWPNLRGESNKHSGLWVQDSKRSIISRVEPGDFIAIYESGSGKTPIIHLADGTKKKLPRQRGRQGIVEIHQITSNAYESEDSEPERYSDGTEKWWRWQADTKRITSAGFVYRKKLAKYLGMSEEYPFKGFGDGHSGLKEINEDEFTDIVEHYQQDRRESDFSKKSQQSNHNGGVSGGEGPAHKALKLAIAENPEILGEKGLELVGIEFGFVTGDRIDVLLRDSFGRMVPVEVEGECTEYEVAGPLQCMKYRALIAYHFDREVQEVRSILAAPIVHRKVSEKLSRYGVEVCIVGPV